MAEHDPVNMSDDGDTSQLTNVTVAYLVTIGAVWSHVFYSGLSVSGLKSCAGLS